MTAPVEATGVGTVIAPMLLHVMWMSLTWSAFMAARHLAGQPLGL